MRSAHAILASCLLLAGLAGSARTVQDAPPPIDPDSYAVGAQVSNAGGRSTWTYTITKATAETTEQRPAAPIEWRADGVCEGARGLAVPESVRFGLSPSDLT